MLVLILLIIAVVATAEATSLQGNVEVLTPQQAEAVNGQEFDYSTFFGGRIVIRLNGTIILGDYGIKATFCSKSSPYYCVNSDAFTFAVPKSLTGARDAWVVSGHRYKVSSSLRYMTILGHALKVMVILSTDRAPNGKTGSTYFYYSPQLGLLGYSVIINSPSGHTLNKGPVIYLLENKKGFGALPSN